MCFLLYKGVPCHFGEEIQTPNFYIYNINEVIIQTQKFRQTQFS